MKKTNALRILDQLNMTYESLVYKYDSENLSVAKIAKENEWQLEEIFKTLVVKGDKNGVTVAVIAANQTLDFKQLAKVSQNKKINLLPTKELLRLTGYIRGGCSPIGMKKNFPVFVDLVAAEREEIFINAGARGLLVKIRVEDLLQATNGRLENISTPNK